MRPDCPFCVMVIDQDNPAPGVVDSEGFGFNIEPLNPVVPGHRIFLPYSHYDRHNPDTFIVIGELMIAAARYAKKQSGDFNLIINQGPSASQTMDHIHVHYVPRQEGDGLKLPWTDQHKRNVTAILAE